MKSTNIGLQRLRGILIILLVAIFVFAGCNRGASTPEDSPNVTSPPPIETIEPTIDPGDTSEPIDSPEPDDPTDQPDLSPTLETSPTAEPTDTPTAKPTVEPTKSPKPTTKPTNTPKPSETVKPTDTPTEKPTEKPPSPTPIPTPLDVDIGFLKQVEDKIVGLCNVERGKVGLHPLVSNEVLNEIARYKSEEMGLYDYFDHISTVTGYEPWDLAKIVFKYEYLTYGENIWKTWGENYPESQFDAFVASITAEKIVQGWMESEGHRLNILRKEYYQIGVGVAICSDFRAYATQVFSD